MRAETPFTFSKLVSRSLNERRVSLEQLLALREAERLE